MILVHDMGSLKAYPLLFSNSARPLVFESFWPVYANAKLNYLTLFGKMSPRSSPERALFGEEHRPDPKERR